MKKEYVSEVRWAFTWAVLLACRQWKGSMVVGSRSLRKKPRTNPCQILRAVVAVRGARLQHAPFFVAADFSLQPTKA